MISFQLIFYLFLRKAILTIDARNYDIFNLSKYYDGSSTTVINFNFIRWSVKPIGQFYCQWDENDKYLTY